MNLIQVTLANDDQPAFIYKEHIVAFYKIPNQPDRDYSIIKTTGGHEFIVKQNFQEVSKLMSVPSDVFFVK